jgi:hypothetical protein
VDYSQAGTGVLKEVVGSIPPIDEQLLSAVLDFQWFQVVSASAKKKQPAKELNPLAGRFLMNEIGRA